MGLGKRRGNYQRSLRLQAFTLAEICIVAALFAIVFVMLLSFFYSGQRRSHDLDFRLRSMQSAHLLRARLAADLSAHLPGPPSETPIKDAVAVTFLRVPDGKGQGPGGLTVDERLRPKAKPVTYRFDAKRHQVLRNGHPLKVGRFKDVRFSLLPYVEGNELGETVRVRMTCLPEMSLDNPKATGDGAIELAFSFHCPQTTLTRVYNEWAGP